MRTCTAALAAVTFALMLSGCGDDDPEKPGVGFLSVFVVDDMAGPVSGQAITISPAGREAETGAEGTVLFELTPGAYFVDADVCCVGPGFIEYHVPVTVERGDTARVTLDACLACE